MHCLIHGGSMKSAIKLPHSHELAERKGDHIELAQKARTDSTHVDSRFNYEPMFFSHPTLLSMRLVRPELVMLLNLT